MKSILKFFLVFFVFVLTSCSTLSERFVDQASFEHSVTKVFLEFEEAVKQGKTFEELKGEYFTPNEQKKIDKAKGWGVFPYSAPYIAVNEGTCESIVVQEERGRPILNCKGKILVKSMFIGDQTYPMELKLPFKLYKNRWYFDRAGLKHTTPEDGRSTIRGMRLW